MDASPVNEPSVEPPTAGAPDAVEPLAPLVPSTPPQGVARQTRSGSRLPLWLAIVVGVVSLLCVSGLGIGYHYYDKATKPNRSSPDVVVDNYLRAALLHRSGTEAGLYTCKDQSGLADFNIFVAQIISQPDLGADWSSFTEVQSSGSSVLVDVTLRIEQSGGSAGEQNAPWEFTVQRIDGWCVGGAKPLGE